MRSRANRQAPGNSMLLGTCAGLSASSGMPAPALRLAALVMACLWFKLTILAYCLGALYYRFWR